MVVQHNLTAMNANRMLGLTTSSQAKSTEKLSSGYKINRAADDAAGLSISEKMRKQIRGLSQASLNAQDGISAVQTAEGALTEVHDMLQRMNELAIKAANGTMSEDDRSYVQDEIDQLVTEIDRVSETTKFNETYLLKGTTGTKTVETEASVTVSYNSSITGVEKLVWDTGSTTTDKYYATKDGKSVEIAESNYKDYVELDKRSVVDSVKINDSSQVFTETGTTALSGAQLKEALNTGETLYTSKAQTEAVKGTDYTITDAEVKANSGTFDGNSTATEGDIHVDNTVATGTYIYNGSAWENKDTGAVAAGITVDAGKKLTKNDTIEVTGATATIAAGKTLYAEGGKDPLTADQVLAADNNDEKLYTDAYSLRTEAAEGVDYTAETHEETFIKAKDGYQIYVVAPDETTAFGDQKTPATETQLNDRFNVTSDLLLATEDNGTTYYTVSADKLADFFDENGVYQGGLYSVDNNAKKEIGAEQIDNYVTWERVEASSEEVETEEALTFSLQVGADTTPENKITIDIESMSAKGLGIEGLRVDGADSTNADAAVEVIADAIQKVSTQRSALGAVQNRLEHTINNLDNVVENTTSAESQIRDTDMATEMVKYSNNNILAQAGQAMLAQANQSNQGVLSLLG